MDMFRKPLNIDFVAKRRPAYSLSIAAMLLSFLLLGFRGLNFGIDFTGGTLVEMGFPQAVDTAYVSKHLEKAGVTISTAQHFGNDRDVLVRTIGAYQRLGCWGGGVEIGRAAYEAALDVFEFSGQIRRHHRYEQVVVSPPAG